MGRYRRHSSGFSFIEIIVVAVPIAGVSLTIVSMLRMQQRGLSSLAQSSEFENLETLLKLSLSNPLTCDFIGCQR